MSPIEDERNVSGEPAWIAAAIPLVLDEIGLSSTRRRAARRWHAEVDSGGLTFRIRVTADDRLVRIFVELEASLLRSLASALGFFTRRGVVAEELGRATARNLEDHELAIEVIDTFWKRLDQELTRIALSSGGAYRTA